MFLQGLYMGLQPCPQEEFCRQSGQGKPPGSHCAEKCLPKVPARWGLGGALTHTAIKPASRNTTGGSGGSGRSPVGSSRLFCPHFHFSSLWSCFPASPCPPNSTTACHRDNRSVACPTEGALLQQPGHSCRDSRHSLSVPAVIPGSSPERSQAQPVCPCRASRARPPPACMHLNPLAPTLCFLGCPPHQ